jgi:site-specific recombinase XerD
MDAQQIMLEKFLDYKKYQGRSATTLKTYRLNLNRLIIFLRSQDNTIFSVNSAELKFFTGEVAYNEGLSSASRCVLIAAVRQFFNWLVENGLEENSAENLTYPSKKYSLPMAATLETAQALINTPDLSNFAGLRDTAILFTFVATGARVSGIAALNRESLYFTQNKGREKLVIQLIEKGAKERLVPVHQACALILRAFLGHKELEKIDCTTEKGENVLFPSLKNTHLNPFDYRGEARRMSRQAMAMIIKKHGKKAGLPASQLHPHALRHLYGTQMTEAGVGILQLQALMGHADPKTTQGYVRLATKQLAACVDDHSPLSKLNSPIHSLMNKLAEDANKGM